MTPKFKTIYSPEATAIVNLKPDTRSYVERMFQDFNPQTGECVALPVRLQNGAKFPKFSDAYMEPNSIQVITNLGAEIPDYTELNGLVQGETILVIGGNRQGKAGQGRLPIPLSQVDAFCETLKALASAVQDEQNKPAAK